MENQFIHKFSILEDLIVPILLGLDFLNEHEFKLDFANNKLSFGDEDEISIINNSDPKPKMNFAKLSASVVLPPYSIITIPVMPDKGVSAGQMILSPAEQLQSEWNLIGANVLVDIADGHCPYQLINPHPIEIFLPKNSITASVSEPACIEINDDLLEQVFILQTETAGVQALDEITKLGIYLSNSDLTEVDKGKLASFLINNRDIFAKKLRT